MKGSGKVSYNRRRTDTKPNAKEHRAVRWLREQANKAQKING